MQASGQKGASPLVRRTSVRLVRFQQGRGCSSPEHSTWDIEEKEVFFEFFGVKDEFGRDIDHWSQGNDKVKDLVGTDKKK